MEAPPEPRQKINPYAPAGPAPQESREPEMIGSVVGSAGIPNKRVTLSTIRAVACSGATFGFLFGGLICAYALLSMFRVDRVKVPEQMAFAAGFYLTVPALVGFVLAALAGSVVVPLMMWLVGNSEAFGGNTWERSSIRLFAALCGTVSGWGSLVVFSWLHPLAILIGLVPAAVGLVATPLFLRRLMREADQNHKTY